MVKRINTELMRVHKDFKKKCIEPLRKIMAKKRGMDEDDISIAEVTLELTQRVQRIGFKELP